MARKVTLEELMKEGATKEMAERILKLQDQRKPRDIWWQFKGSEQYAAQVMKTVPGLMLVKRFKTKEKGQRADKAAAKK